MSSAPTLQTNRLILRGWKQQDRAPYALLNADPRVMEWLHGLMSREKSDASADRIEACWQEQGWSLFALERKDTGAFIGYCGVWPVRFEHTFTPSTEIGWRMAFEHWGNGFITEAAQEVLRWIFGDLDWPEIISFTQPGNLRSRAVMEGIGMTREPSSDFVIPAVEEKPATPQVFYRLTAAEWAMRHAAGSGAASEDS